MTDKSIHISLDQNWANFIRLLEKYQEFIKKHSNNSTITTKEKELFEELLKEGLQLSKDYGVLLELVESFAKKIELDKEPKIDLEKGYLPQSEYIKFIYNNPNLINSQNFMKMTYTLVNNILQHQNYELTSEQKKLLAETTIFLLEQLIKQQQVIIELEKKIK